MPLTVLSDSDVGRILHSFDRDDIFKLQESMADALHWYSTSNDANEYCSDFQPERTSLKRKDGSTTMFMAASGLAGQGIKVVSIAPPDAVGLPSLAENLSISSGDSKSSPRTSISTTRTTESTASSSVSSLAGSSTDNIGVGQAPVSSDSGASASTIKGSLTLLDRLGNTIGLINAAEVTAFRTALASTMLLKKRQSVHDLSLIHI